QEQLTQIKSLDGSSSYPSYLGTINGKGIFIAYNQTVGREIWATDGTPAGTYLLKDLVPLIQEPFYGQNVSTTIKDGYLYFSAALLIPSIKPELWRTDGTPAGTTKVLDSMISDSDLQQAYDTPNNLSRAIYLLSSAEFFFVVIHYDSKMLIKKYDNDFNLLHTEYREPRGEAPILFQNKIILDEGIYESGKGFLNKGNFGIGDTFYQTCISTNVVQTFPEWGRVRIIENGKESFTSINLQQGPPSSFFKATYFVYQNQLYACALIVHSSDTDPTVRLTADFYALEPSLGFQLRKSVELINYQNNGSYYFYDAALWQAENQVNIVYNSTITKTFRHVSIRLEDYLLQEEKILTDVNALYPDIEHNRFLGIRDTQLKGRIYDGKTKQLTPFSKPYPPQLKGAIAPNLWMARYDYIYDEEPYVFNSETGALTLLKNINDVGDGITKTDTLNNRVLFFTLAEQGLNLYASDGTKNGLKLLSTVSSRYESDNLYTITPKRYGNELVYESRGRQFSNTDYSYLYAVTNGIDKTFTLFESNQPLAISILHKTGGYYYHAFAATSTVAPIDTITIVRYTNDGTQDALKKVAIAVKNQAIHSFNSSRIVADKYLVASSVDVFPYYGIAFVIDITTGTRVDSADFKWIGELNNRILFQKVREGTSDLYTLDNTTQVKILEDYPRFTGITKLADSYLFFNGTSIYVYNGITNEARPVINGLQLSYIGQSRKIEGGTLMKAGASPDVADFKLLKGNVLEKTSIKPTHSFASDSLLSVYLDGKSYYFFKGINDSQGIIYRYNGTDFEEATTFNMTNLNSVIAGSKGYFYENNNQLFFWSPTQGHKLLMAGIYGFSKEWQVGRNTLIKTHSASSVETIFIVTDGTPGKLKLFNLGIPYQANIVLKHENKVYLQSTAPTGDTEFWEADSTANDIKKIASFDQSAMSFSYFAVVNDIPVCLVNFREQGNQLFSLKPTFSAPIIAIPNSQACEGQEVLLTAPKDFDNYLWKINGMETIRTTTNKLSVTKTGSYQVVVEKGEKTSLPSNIVGISFVPLPPKPTITLADLQLI
ncbi:MAG TPA: hypothetical protein VGE24_03250, partial [Emticicia sp.]